MLSYYKSTNTDAEAGTTVQILTQKRSQAVALPHAHAHAIRHTHAEVVTRALSTLASAGAEDIRQQVPIKALIRSLLRLYYGSNKGGRRGYPAAGAIKAILRLYYGYIKVAIALLRLE